MLADLHTHTTASDGALTPSGLLARAAANGVTHLAITDHDTLDAYSDLGRRIEGHPELIPGIEFSTTWRKIGVHVIGLNVDLAHPGLRTAVRAQGERRIDRAHRIAERLGRKGIRVCLDELLANTGNASVGRPHFADYLVRAGHVRDVATAFRLYLGAGKPGDVRNLWPEPAAAVGWIVAAGGVAVLANPAHYRLTTTRLRELLRDFRECGGGGIEVVSGQQNAATTLKLGRLATEFGLAASCGSDFHAPSGPWSEPGRFQPLPDANMPVWDLW